MMPDWKTREGATGFNEVVSKIINMHKGKCSSLAMILDGFMSLELHTVLKHHNKESFYCEDIIFESLTG